MGITSIASTRCGWLHTSQPCLHCSLPPEIKPSLSLFKTTLAKISSLFPSTSVNLQPLHSNPSKLQFQRKVTFRMILCSVRLLHCGHHCLFVTSFYSFYSFYSFVFACAGHVEVQHELTLTFCQPVTSDVHTENCKILGISSDWSQQRWSHAPRRQLATVSETAWSHACFLPVASVSTSPPAERLGHHACSFGMLSCCFFNN